MGLLLVDDFAFDPALDPAVADADTCFVPVTEAGLDIAVLGLDMDRGLVLDAGLDAGLEPVFALVPVLGRDPADFLLDPGLDAGRVVVIYQKGNIIKYSAAVTVP